MKLSAVICALAASSAAAFSATTTSHGMTMSATSDRRAAITKIAGFAALVAAPTVASADGAVSGATISRAKGIYGSRIYDLKGAVEAGDFKAVIDEKNVFILFNSGAYPGVKNKELKAKAIAGTNAIFAAVRSKDKAALKAAYASYVADNKVTGLPELGVDGGQGFGNDYDFKSRTKAGAVYQR